MSKLALALCAGSTFLGAALLFAVQPLLAKWPLPWFGGSPSTWAACMVRAQAVSTLFTDTRASLISILK